MHLHHTAENIPILLNGKSVYRFFTGEGLEAKLA